MQTGESLAAWRRSHQFGIIRAMDPEGEVFSVLPTEGGRYERVPAWRGRSQSELHDHLRAWGISGAEIAEALAIARAWTTTVTRVID